MILQIAIIAINNSAGPNRIIPTLLVFSVYLRLTKIDPLSLSVTKKTKAIRAVTKEVCYLYIERQVKDTLAIHNGPDTKITLDLPFQLEVHIQCKKKGWKGLYKLIVINGETYTLNMPQGPTKFQLIIVKLYLTKRPD